MAELEQLRADIKTLEQAKSAMEAAKKRHFPAGHWKEISEWAITTELKAKLAALEAEEAKKEKADRWREAKDLVSRWGRYDVFTGVCGYINHLESEVQRLEAFAEERRFGPEWAWFLFSNNGVVITQYWKANEADAKFAMSAYPDVVLAMVQEIERLRAVGNGMLTALEKAVADYGKPGGPWNVPSEPGEWIEMARNAIEKARDE